MDKDRDLTVRVDPDSDDDEKALNADGDGDSISQAGSIMSVLSLGTNSTSLKWKTLGSEVLYSVSYINIPEQIAQEYLNRHNEEAYKTSCDEKREYNLPLFPADASVLRHFPHLIEGHEEIGLAIVPSDGIRFREEFLYLSTLVKAVRIRRIVLLDKYIKLKTKIRKYEDFLSLCNGKMEAHLKRLAMLENELLLFEPFDSFQSTSLLGSFLSNTTGWSTTLAQLVKEFKYIQQKERDAMERATENPDAGPEVEDENSVLRKMEGIIQRQGLGIDRNQIHSAWELIRFWQVIYSAAVRAQFGLDGVSMYKANSTPKKTATEDLVVKQKQLNKKPSRSSSAVIPLEEASSPPPENSSSKSFSRRSSSRVLSHRSSSVGAPLKSPTNAPEANDLSDNLQPMLPCGQAGIATWDAVCSFLSVEAVPSAYTGKKSGLSQSEKDAEEIQSITGVVKAIADLVTNRDSFTSMHNMARELLLPIISKVSVSNLLYSIREELDPLAVSGVNESAEETNELFRSIGTCLLDISDDIARALEELLLEPIRRLSVWTSLLEGMRRERVKKEGGKISIRDNAEVEVDEQGAIRVIPNADEIVDTDVLHGSRQRVRIQVAIPQAESRLKSMRAARFDLEGEMASVTQLGFEAAVPYIQRTFRKCIIRHRLDRLYCNLALYSMHAAASSIQRIQRGRIGRERFQQFAFLRRNSCATTIQKIIRGYLGRRKATEMYNFHTFSLETNGAVAMQRIVRGFLARRVVKEILKQAADEKMADNRAWAIMILQKVARGYIARNSIVRSRHIRNNLSPEVLKLAERYMCDTRGDLWGFLKEVDETMKRYSKNIEESQNREDLWADTFVQKVIAMRENKFDGAWTDFANMQKAKAPTMGPDPATINSPSRVKARRGVGESAFEESMLSILASDSPVKILPDSTGMNRSWNGIDAPNPPPGILLRRAVSSTMQQRRAGQSDRSSTKKGLDPTKASRLQTFRDTYSDVKSRKRAGTSTKSVRPPPGAMKKKKKSSVFTATSKFTVEENKKSSVSQAYLKEEWMEESPLMKALNSDKRVESPPRTGSNEIGKDQVHLIHNHGKVDPGVSLLIDIPLGIDDKLERLINAAAMRCYVPEIFTRSRSVEGSPPISHTEAYSMYQTLPQNSLAKMRYEQKVQQWCMPTVNKLRLKGFNYIKEALPASKMGMFLKGVDTPPLLSRQIMDLVYRLQALDNVPAGMMRREMKTEFEGIKSDQATLKTTLHAAVSGRHTHHQAETEEVGRTRIAEELNMASCVDKEHIMNIAQRFVEKMISMGPWAKLDAAVDTLLQNAAFLIVPFESPNHATDVDFNAGDIMTLEGLFGAEAETSEELRMGQLAFTKFANYLVSCESEDSMKSAIRDRFRAAVILSTPYELKLKQIGVMFVKDLCIMKGENASNFLAVSEILNSMPKPFLHQVEALCSMAISVTSESRFYSTDNSQQAPASSSKSFAKLKASSIPGPLAQNPRLIQVPLAFDARFQRGPWDPYGRPPRIAGQLPSLRQSTKEAQRSRSLVVNKGSVMPEIGAEIAVSLTIQEAAKRQREIALELEATGKYLSADMREMYGSIPHNLWEVQGENSESVHGLSLSDQNITAADPSLAMWAFEPSRHHRAKEGDHFLAPTDSSGANMDQHHYGNELHGGLHDMSTGRDEYLLARHPTPQPAEVLVNRPEISSRAMPSHAGVRQLTASRQSCKATKGNRRRVESASLVHPALFDTETRFDRPHKCSFEGCSQAFSRVYTLKLHEKSHLMFPEYHKFRHDPLLSLDADAEMMMKEARQKLMTRENLPLMRELELERTLLLSSQNASSAEW